MPYNHVEWAEEELDWTNIDQRTLDNFAEGYDEEEALQYAIKAEITAWANRTGKLDGSDTGIWNDSGKLWAGGTGDDKTYSGWGNRVKSDIAFLERNGKEIQKRTELKSFTRAQRLDSTTLRVYEMSADGTTEVAFDFEYQKVELDYAQNRGII